MDSITMTIPSFLISSLFFFLLSTPNSATASDSVPAVFAFGDSTIDPGNNNHINTLFRGYHSHYSRVATGRFSNGKIATDYLTNILGIKDVLPAYLDPRLTDCDLLTGVSFGSGGSGLDNRTLALTRAMGLETQFELFEEALRRIRKIVGDEKTNDIVQNALFVISTGTNDMLYNAYLIPIRFIGYGSVSAYQDFLLQNLQAFIQRLYGAGARRIMVSGLPPIGCLPQQVTLTSIFTSRNWPLRVCNYQQNKDSEYYNLKLQSQLHFLRTTLTGAKVAYFDIYTPILDMVQFPHKYGFVQSRLGCCGTGLMEMGPVCNALELTCPDPSKYLFWDAVHLTQAGYKVLAETGRQSVLPYLTS
ncbi:GDSL esterase/lipase At2g40250 [Lotus japonicus]|uniref:GDSL esterase/lipase At2g40250 n=1 Tax=Lotus japonicus TaxID=34305 RepID=UPI002590BDB1|nr:GDSL esterase/lipase At2g40250 [Lotus japonicus]